MVRTAIGPNRKQYTLAIYGCGCRSKCLEYLIEYIHEDG